MKRVVDGITYGKRYALVLPIEWFFYVFFRLLYRMPKAILAAADRERKKAATARKIRVYGPSSLGRMLQDG